MKKYGRLEYIIINYYLLLSLLKSTTVLLFVTKAVTYIRLLQSVCYLCPISTKTELSSSDHNSPITDQHYMTATTSIFFMSNAIPQSGVLIIFRYV